MEIDIHYGFQAVNFKHRSTAAQDKGGKLYKAGHVYQVKERKYVTDISMITAKVIRQTSVNKEPYNVELEVNKNRDVVKAACSCIAGVAGYCKHISSLVIYINNEYAISKTSNTNEWQGAVLKTKKAATGKYSKGKKIRELYPVRNNIKNEVDIPYGITSSDLENVTCPLLHMLQAEESQDFVTEYVDRNNNASNTCSKLDCILKQIFDSEVHDVVGVDMIFLHPCCERTYNKFVNSDGYVVCKETLDDKVNWFRQRKFRITASRCYELYTYNKSEWEKKIHDYIFRKMFTNGAVRHGLEYEDEARNIYEQIENLEVVQTGLIICKANPWLGASPDGIIIENGTPKKLLEIKCPFKGKTISANEIMPHCSFLKNVEGETVLKKKHCYYAQIQVNLLVTGLSECDLVVYCSFDKMYKKISIKKDLNFCNNLVQKLGDVYFNHILHYLCECINKGKL